jgi:hypothetical protein
MVNSIINLPDISFLTATPRTLAALGRPTTGIIIWPDITV